MVEQWKKVALREVKEVLTKIGFCLSRSGEENGAFLARREDSVFISVNI